MTPEQVIFLDYLKDRIFAQSQGEDFIPIHLGIDWQSATVWSHKLADMELRRIFLNEAIAATQTKGDHWRRDPKVKSEFRYKSDKGLYLWMTSKFLLYQNHGKASLNFSFIQRVGLIEKLVRRLNSLSNFRDLYQAIS